MFEDVAQALGELAPQDKSRIKFWNNTLLVGKILAKEGSFGKLGVEVIAGKAFDGHVMDAPQFLGELIRVVTNPEAYLLQTFPRSLRAHRAGKDLSRARTRERRKLRRLESDRPEIRVVRFHEKVGSATFSENPICLQVFPATAPTASVQRRSAARSGRNELAAGQSA
jgi:hypothetical protein